MKYKTQDALPVAERIVSELNGAVEQIRIGGDIARKAKSCDVIEIFYIPRFENRRLGVFGRGDVDLTTEKIAWLHRSGFFDSTAGIGKKLPHPFFVHKTSGIPVLMRKLSPDTLIDVWKVSMDGSSFITEHEKDAIAEAQVEEGESEPTITKIKMHRELLECLPEFDGF